MEGLDPQTIIAVIALMTGLGFIFNLLLVLIFFLAMFGYFSLFPLHDCLDYFFWHSFLMKAFLLDMIFV